VRRRDKHLLDDGIRPAGAQRRLVGQRAHAHDLAIVLGDDDRGRVGVVDKRPG
jgi:hypothetical protein